MIATAARALVHGPLWAWKLVAAAAATALALVGPIGFVREWVKRVALWVVLASLAYLTWWALHDAHLGALWSRPGKGGLSFWQGVDLMVAMPVSWLPLAADYTRFSRSGRGAFWGAAVGYFLPNVWLYALGAILLLTRGLTDAPSVIGAIATGGARRCARARRARRRRDEGAVRERLLGRRLAAERRCRACRSGCSSSPSQRSRRPGRSSSTSSTTRSSCYLLGSFFVPLFGVLLAQWRRRRARPVRVRPRSGPPRSPRGSPASASISGSRRSGRARGSTSSTTRTPVRERSAARCRASASPSCCRSRLRLLVVRPLAVIGPLSRDVVDGPRRTHRRRPVVRGAGAARAAAGGCRRREMRRARAALVPTAARSARRPRDALRGRRDDGLLLQLRRGRQSGRCGSTRSGSRGARATSPSACCGAPSGCTSRRCCAATSPPETLERIARRRRLLLDGHGLVRRVRSAHSSLDGEFDRALLRHVSILKLAEEEAQAILGHGELEELRELGVPEIVVTFGGSGSLVLTRDAAVRVAARPVRGDPTGAGDAFSVAYLGARASGHRPISAARRASALVSALLSNSLLRGRTRP